MKSEVHVYLSPNTMRLISKLSKEHKLKRGEAIDMLASHYNNYHNNKNKILNDISSAVYDIIVTEMGRN